ncbi:MAG: DUF2807 domain-containing protein [Bacteroidales bacterium]|nr:DUF2807 domain-containing protein [Bacteroidales bacterium]
MKKPIFVIIIGLLLLASCREKDLDMTVVQKTLYENASITGITANDAWHLTIIHDEQAFVELEYSAFLEDYILAQKEGSELTIGFNTQLYLPANTVMNATVHLPALQKLHCSEAVSAQIQGDFSGDELTVELNDASTLKGGAFTGNAAVMLTGASTMVDFGFTGDLCSINLFGASVFKGVLNVNQTLGFTAADASRLTLYGGAAPNALAEIKDASIVNTLETEIQQLQLLMTSASEASVFVTQEIHGTLRDASLLYYQGNPTLDLDTDETSSIHPL